MEKICPVCGRTFKVCPVEAQRERHCSYACRHNVAARFWAKVDKSGECWLWTGRKDDGGYGRFTFNGKERLAHRVSYELTHGPIPEGQDIRHLECDTPACVRPDHLKPGSHLQNMQDMYSKGRREAVRGENHGNAKLTWAEVQEIRQKYQPRIYGCSQLGKEYGVHPALIHRIVKNKAWRDETAAATGA